MKKFPSPEHPVYNNLLAMQAMLQPIVDSPDGQDPVSYRWVSALHSLLADAITGCEHLLAEDAVRDVDVDGIQF
jgi:hypothetical protein